MAISEALTARTTLRQWEYLVGPLADAGGLKKYSAGLALDRLNEVGSRGRAAVDLTLKKGDLVAWPVVLLKRPIGSPSRY